MLSDCTLEGQGPAIMEEACPSPQAHERFRPKLGPPGYPLAKIGERRPHIVQQQIRIEMDHLAIERLDRARRDECWDMTLRTPEPMKEFATFVISTEWRGWGEESNEVDRSEEHTSELQSQFHLVCRLLLEKKKSVTITRYGPDPQPY